MPVTLSCPQGVGDKAVRLLHASLEHPTSGATSLSTCIPLKTQLRKYTLSRRHCVFRRYRSQQVSRQGRLHLHASDQGDREVSREEVAAQLSEEAPGTEEPPHRQERKALVKHDWITDPTSFEAYDRWISATSEKHGGLPLPAVISLTAGSLALAIILALQGWGKVRHRVPSSIKLPISTPFRRHNGTPEQKTDSKEEAPGTEINQSALSMPLVQKAKLKRTPSEQEKGGEEMQNEQLKAHLAGPVPSREDIKNGDSRAHQHLENLDMKEAAEKEQKVGHLEPAPLISDILPGVREASPVLQTVSFDGAFSKHQPDLRGVMVLQPLLDVSPQQTGDSPKAPPSSPVQHSGQSQDSREESTTPAPAGLLKTAADTVIHQAKHLVEQAIPDSKEEQEDRKEEEEGVEKQDTSGDRSQSAEKKESAPHEQDKENGHGQEAQSDQSSEQKEGFLPLLGLPHLPDSDSLESHSLASSKPAPAEDDASHPSLAGGEDAALQQPPARGNSAKDQSAGVGGLDSFQEWYAKHKSPAASTGEGSAPEKRSTKKLKPSTYVDTSQAQALQALQKLSVIEEDVDPIAACSRRDFARWLLNGSGVLSGNSATRRVFPVPSDGVTERAFDDVSPGDQDFAFIQGLAEAGIIPSKLSHPHVVSKFHPNEPLSRQELVRWRLALDRRRLPLDEDPAKAVSESWGFTDVALIDSDALPAILADYQAGEQSVIGRAFGYTLRFQPQKSVSIAQAASALASGSASEFLSDKVSEMEAYKAADEVFLEEAREHRAIVDAVAARGEELVKKLEEDKGTLEETRKAVDEAVAELESRQAAIREENVQLAQAVEEARAVIQELSSVRSVSEGERSALGADLQKLSDQRAALESTASEAMDMIDDEIKRARAAAEGLGGVREVLIEGKSQKEVGEREKPFVEVFDEGVEAASERSKNILKEAARIAKRNTRVAREKAVHLYEDARSSGANGLALLRERSRHVAEKGSDFLQEAPERIRASVPSDVKGRVRELSQTVWLRVEGLLARVWETLLSIWHWILVQLKAGKEQARHVFDKIHLGNRDASSKSL